jgi:hypothetical protein
VFRWARPRYQITDIGYFGFCGSGLSIVNPRAMAWQIGAESQAGNSIYRAPSRNVFVRANR